LKALIVSDIHGSLPAAKAAVSALARLNADLLFLLGDLLYHGPRNPLPEGYAPAEVAAALNEVREYTLAVRGNCDGEVDQAVLAFPMLSEMAIAMDEARRIVLTHGHHELAEGLLPAGTLHLSGHTHIAGFWEEGGVFRANPGSSSLPKNGAPKSLMAYEKGSLTLYNLEDLSVLSEYALS